MKCDFCGHMFSPEEAGRACDGCPLHPGCALIRCPACGYEAYPEPGLVKWVRNLFAGDRQSRAAASTGGSTDPKPLADMFPGQRGIVARVSRAGGSERDIIKLMAMGIFPGVALELERREPSFVYRSGYSEFAIDAELARLVLVRISGEGEI